jgi:ribosomal protein L21E
MNDYGQIRHDLTQFQVGDMVEFEIEVMTFKGQSYDRIGSIKKVSDEPDTSFNHGANVEPVQQKIVSSNNKYDDYLKEITQAYSAIESNETLKNLDQENKRAIAISAVINQMRNGR